MGLMWNPNEHTDDENVQWRWLRAVEWIRWPLFISQPIVPVMLIFSPWPFVILMVLVTNLLWYLFVRPVIVILPLSQFAVYFVRVKWIFCPAMAFYFYSIGQKTNAWIALLWPILIIAAPMVPVVGLLFLAIAPPRQSVQKRFMMALGYQPREDVNP